MCVSSLRYPACNARAPYFYLWPGPLCSTFRNYLIKGTISEKNVIEHKIVFRISLKRLSEVFFVLRRIERDMIQNLYWSSCRSTVILVRFLRNLDCLDFSKNPQTSNLMKILPVGVGSFHEDRRADIHDEANSSFSKFCERAQKYFRQKF